MTKRKKFIIPFENVSMKDVALVGGKNASLGEMIRELGVKGVKVPGGFIVTAEAYRYFLKKSKCENKNLRKNPKSKSQTLEKFIKDALRGLDVRNLKDLARRGALIRKTITETALPPDLRRDIVAAYRTMERRYYKNVDVAVRSSATAEDLPDASFAGEHETYLGIRGAEDVIRAVRAAFASLFTDRAISYRENKKFDHFSIALSVGVEKMVRSDKGAAGVMFTLDTESGFKDVILINGSWGLGEMIVQGEVTPDEFVVWKKGVASQSRITSSVISKNPIIDKKLGVKTRKMIYAKKGAGVKMTKIVATTPRERESFVLKDDEILTLANWGVIIEEHYSNKRRKWTPMDIEWAKDGATGELFIVQARPETVHSLRDYSKIREYVFAQSARRRSQSVIVRGASVGSKIASGKARVILDAKHIGEFKKGEILITAMTDPDWEPIMKIASAIVTDKGGRTSHAAIVSRELGIPAVVGTENATKKIKTGEVITVDATGSEGFVMKGALKFNVVEHDVRKIPKPSTKIMVNVAIPENAFGYSFLPNSGVGLAREEFIIASKIGIHPNALIEYDKQPEKIKKQIDLKTRGWKNKIRFYVDNLAFGIAKIGAAFYPNPVIVRFSDFKTNEYRTLLGGDAYEPEEENPMLGWRGASRYYDPKFEAAFGLECKALKKVREEMGLTNVIPMVPFCRTPEEGKKVIATMAKYGLKREESSKSVRRAYSTRARSDAGLKIYVMCEIPSNVLLADEFLDIFDGMSIGSNDLTQLTLGLDRDSGIVSHIANENDPALMKLIADVIKKCKSRKKYIGICGQAPSDYPEFTEFLLKQGIESISLNPDMVVKTMIAVVKKEKGRSRL